MNGQSGQQRRWLPILGVFAAAVVWIVTLVGVRASDPGGPPILRSTGGNSTVWGDSPQAAGAKPPAKAQAPAPAPSKAKASSPAATYVGEDTCITCHSAQTEGYDKTAHHRATDPRTPAAAKSCETCHGPGSEHVADPVSVQVKNFKTAKSADANAVCTTCHNRGEHALWDTSTHALRGVACTSCHSIHAAESAKGQLKKKTQIELCAQCHRDKVAKLQMVGHMPVREGKMECSSCHNTHGSTNAKMLRVGDSVTELCTSCHAEKRGPYLWEHAPTREGCTTCHDPHGSNNERMLVAKLPMLCQRCHVSSRHPPTIYDQTQLNKESNRLLSRACVNCHAAIHGSNHPAGNFFLR
jgi:DmsE family decaheme c-type cytochrome